METTEIMTNGEVIETTEEIVKSNKGFKIAAGVGLTVLAGGLAYKFVVKPLVAKIKSKKYAIDADEDCAEVVSDSDED